MKCSLLLTLAAAGWAVLQAQTPTVGGTCPVFPADNIWNTAIDQLPVHPSSATWVSTIGASSPLHPDFGSGTYDGGAIGIPFVTVPGTQTKYSASFTYQSESDPGPYAIPLNAPIEAGGDGHAIAIDTTNCILYEIYQATPHANSWTGGSGAIFNLQSDALRPASWTSADAAGLPIFPGLIRYEEVAAGAIHHAIRFTVPHTLDAYVWPARHEASSLTGSQYPPMGARFRLKASVDISKFSAANQVILQALKTYGMILADNGSSWYISGAPNAAWSNDDLHSLTTIIGSNFEAVDVSPLMVDPNSGEASQSSVRVSVSPTSASVQVDKQQQFHAVVSGNSNQAVTWDVNGTVGGNSARDGDQRQGQQPGHSFRAGTSAGVHVLISPSRPFCSAFLRRGVAGFIDSISGLYTAPVSVPSATVTIHASTNVVTPAAVGSATVTIVNPPPPPPPVTITISPTSATVVVKKTHQFTAKVKNTSNTAVTWKVNQIIGGSSALGTISTFGLYTAPAIVPSPAHVTVTAVSVADSTKSASATVTISGKR